MDARIDDVGGVRAKLPRRRAIAARRNSDLSFALTRVLASQRASAWEAAAVVGAILLLGRGPVLFFRIRLSGLFGGPPGALWQDDLVVTCVYGIVLIVVAWIAVRRANASALIRQGPLLAFIAVVWASLAWSVEPTKTARHALMFVGTALVGWYIGDRFSLREQVSLVVIVAMIGTFASIIGLVVWPDLAIRTGRVSGWWSGVYVNRNFLGLMLSYGLLAAMFLFGKTRYRVALGCAVALMVLLLAATKSRTGPVALIVALIVTVAVSLLRRLGRGKLTPMGGATVLLLTLGGCGLLVHLYWSDVLARLGRDATLTGRTEIWQLARWFSDLHPWQGWGFEAIWANAHAIGQAQAARVAPHHASFGTPGGWPYSAHNGYYEMLLGVGRVGLVVFVFFLATAAWRAFHHAWGRRDLVSLWPLSFIIFAVVLNFSESMFVSGEALWALTVAVAVGATEIARRERA